MNILITGATGFIGRRLVEDISMKEGYKIYCLVRHTSRIDALKKYNVKFINADIGDYGSLKRNVPEQIDIVYHLAGYVKNNDLRKLHEVNVVGTENISRLSYDLKVRQMVYTSSVAVVSGNPDVPLVEDMPFKATNVYGQSKIEAEKKVLAYRRKGLKAAIFRPCMIYGEDEPHLLGLIIRLLKYGLLPVFRAGSNKLHLGYVGNVCNALIYSLGRHEFMEGAFFIADTEVLTVREILDILVDEIGARPPLVISGGITNLFVRLPYLGKIVKFSLKDRIYSMKRILGTGYRTAFRAEPSLRSSARSFVEKKQKGSR